MTPWWMLCVDLIGQYALKDNINPSSNFMCLIMIDPTTSRFEIAELPTVTKLAVPNTGKGKKGKTYSPERIFFL
jgi:hypothetical protein